MALFEVNPGTLSGKPEKKEITYTDGITGEEITADVYVKKYGLAQARRLVMAQISQGDSPAENRNLAESIADNIVDEAGNLLFSADDVMDFKQDLVLSLLTAIGEVNNPKLKSPPTKS